MAKSLCTGEKKDMFKKNVDFCMGRRCFDAAVRRKEGLFA